jgi:hypothetical protein
MHSYSALYYPFIHFKDDNWLKLSALYWDDISRVVPEKYQPEDSETVRALKGYVKVLRPTDATPEVGLLFGSFLESHTKPLRARYAVEDRDRAGWTEVPPAQRPPRAGGSSGTDPRLGYVFFEKINPTILQNLVDAGVALRDPVDSRWIGMHPKIANVYMMALADQLAGEKGLYPVTDDALDHVAVGGWTVERLAGALLDDMHLPNAKRSDAELEMIAASVAIEMVIPRRIDEVTPEQILKFRQSHLAGRGAFQAYLSGFLRAREWLREIGDRDELAHRLNNEYEKELVPKLDELRGKLNGVGIDTVSSVLSMQITTPVVFGKAAALLGVATAANPVVVAAGGALGLGLAVFKVYRDRRKATEAGLKSSEASYLMRLERDLAPKTVLERIGRRFRSFEGKD